MGKIEIIKGDITKVHVDAIVNAANSSLLGGGGVDGAIHRAAGPALLRSCQLIGGCNTGEAKMTPGFNLPSKYVIHTVGPVWKGGVQDETRLLASCYYQSLLVASDNGITTIAFPNISTGVYGFPKGEASRIAFKTVQNFLLNHPNIVLVNFCCFDEENFNLYNSMIKNDTTFKKVQTKTAILVTAKLASDIWNEHYVPMIGQEQVDYMVKTFQSPDAIEHLIHDENYEYYIIYHLSEPSGYISVKHIGNNLFLSKFYVIKEKRGTGLGRKGLKFIIRRAKKLGTSSITLTVNKNNINSIKAYEKLGFKNDGPVITEIGSGYIMDDYRMSREVK